jgi:16S rRNA (uracil1498-N3)-methyltransferase
MRRYWLEPHQLNGNEVHFDGDIFHHIFDVCRQEEGNHFEVLLNGKAYLVKVRKVEKKKAVADIVEERQIPPLPRPLIHVVLSISRYQVMDAVVEKLVEMGVASLHPVFSEFSFVRSASSFPKQKMERWQKIIVSATQQCGRGELMELHEPEDLQKMALKINRTSGQLGLFAYEGMADKDIRRFLASKKTPEITDIWCFIGSEGGFSEAEVSQFRDLGFDPVTLGSQVLRVETACMTLVSVLKYEFDLMKA